MDSKWVTQRDLMTELLRDLSIYPLLKFSSNDSTAEITNLENEAAKVTKTKLPRDYIAFLQLIDGSGWFKADSCHTDLRLFNAKDAKWVDIPSEFFLRAMIGNVAYKAMMKGMGTNHIFADNLAQPMRVLQIDKLGFQYLLGPNECSRVARFCRLVSLQSTPIDKSTPEALEHRTSHFGPLSILERMECWSSWIILERYYWGAGDVIRLFPSFSELLKEMALGADLQKKGHWLSTRNGHLSRLPASSRSYWEPVLASSPVPDALPERLVKPEDQ